MQVPRSPQFGAVLFRASELIGSQGADAFEGLGIGLHASKISIVLALHRYGPLSSTQLAEQIGISRQLIESRLKPSVADGFFTSLVDPGDSRKRIYDFAPQSLPEVQRILAVMVDFEQVYRVLWEEIGTDLELALKAMEKALANRSLIDRLRSEFPAYSKQIKDWQ